MDCLFCKIAKNEIPANIIYQDDNVLIFDDINPQAKHHKIIIPRQHIANLNDVDERNSILVGRMVSAAVELAKKLGIDQSGYRLVFNCNEDGGQTVFHIHLHLLGGRRLHWPPG